MEIPNFNMLFQKEITGLYLTIILIKNNNAKDINFKIRYANLSKIRTYKEKK